MKIAGTYYNGQLKLEQPVQTLHPLKVVVHFVENEENSKTKLTLSHFSFLETQELLKEIKSSFSDEVEEERRGDV